VFSEAVPLTRLQRILVGTDGTVTQLLEIYAGQPVEVVKLEQAFDTAGDGDAGLDVSPDDKVLRREVLLRGAHDRRNLLHAQATVVLARVDPGLVDALLATDRPLGYLLAERRTETFREVLDSGREPAGAVGAHFGLAPTADVVARTYRITAGGKPVALVKERFPAGFYRELTV
jgi:chorismate-pyruvate lyase